MVFSFYHLKPDYEQQGAVKGKWVLKQSDGAQFRIILFDWQMEMQKGNSWNAVFLNCHDQPRSVSHFGDDGSCRKESAKALATMIHMLGGTPYIHQGEEIAMKNAGFSSLDQYQDIESINASSIMKERGLDESEIMAILTRKSRDNARTPERFDDSKNVGFTTGTSWIEAGADQDPAYTLQAQMADPDSVWNHYRRLIALRRQHEVISNGTIQPILEDQEGLIAYRRESKEEQLICITSLLDQPETVNLEDIDGFAPVLSSYPDLQPCTDTLNLRPYESIVYLRNRKTK